MKKLLSFLLVFIMLFSILPSQSLGQGFINDLFGKIEEKEPSPTQETSQEEREEVEEIEENISPSSVPSIEEWIKNFPIEGEMEEEEETLSPFGPHTDEEGRYLFQNIPYGISQETVEKNHLPSLLSIASPLDYYKGEEEISLIRPSLEDFPFTSLDFYFDEDQLYAIEFFHYWDIIPYYSLNRQLLYQDLNRLYTFLVQQYGVPASAQITSTLVEGPFLFSGDNQTINEEEFLTLLFRTTYEQEFYLEYLWKNLKFSFSVSYNKKVQNTFLYLSFFDEEQPLFSVESNKDFPFVQETPQEIKRAVNAGNLNRKLLEQSKEKELFFHSFVDEKNRYLLQNVPFGISQETFVEEYLPSIINKTFPFHHGIEEEEVTFTRFALENYPFTYLDVSFNENQLYSFELSRNLDLIPYHFKNYQYLHLFLDHFFTLLVKEYGTPTSAKGRSNLFHNPFLLPNGSETIDEESFISLIALITQGNYFTLEYAWNNLHFYFEIDHSPNENVQRVFFALKYSDSPVTLLPFKYNKIFPLNKKKGEVPSPYSSSPKEISSKETFPQLLHLFKDIPFSLSPEDFYALWEREHTTLDLPPLFKETDFENISSFYVNVPGNSLSHLGYPFQTASVHFDEEGYEYSLLQNSIPRSFTDNLDQYITYFQLSFLVDVLVEKYGPWDQGQFINRTLDLSYPLPVEGDRLHRPTFIAGLFNPKNEDTLLFSLTWNNLQLGLVVTPKAEGAFSVDYGLFYDRNPFEPLSGFQDAPNPHFVTEKEVRQIPPDTLHLFENLPFEISFEELQSHWKNYQTLHPQVENLVFSPEERVTSPIPLTAFSVPFSISSAVFDQQGLYQRFTLQLPFDVKNNNEKQQQELYQTFNGLYREMARHYGAKGEALWQFAQNKEENRVYLIPLDGENLDEKAFYAMFFSPHSPSVDSMYFLFDNVLLSLSQEESPSSQEENQPTYFVFPLEETKPAYRISLSFRSTPYIITPDMSLITPYPMPKEK